MLTGGDEAVEELLGFSALPQLCEHDRDPNVLPPAAKQEADEQYCNNQQEPDAADQAGDEISLGDEEPFSQVIQQVGQHDTDAQYADADDYFVFCNQAF